MPQRLSEATLAKATVCPADHLRSASESGRGRTRPMRPEGCSTPTPAARTRAGASIIGSGPWTSEAFAALLGLILFPQCGRACLRQGSYLTIYEARYPKINKRFRQPFVPPRAFARGNPG